MAKKAFIVGINDYAPVGPGGPDLRGCVNDAINMANSLVICGFPPAGIRLCTNAGATKAGILNGLTWLISGAKAGDSLVFFYSGHGSQVTDTSGDEPDRQDEILCPHDLNWATRTYITDDLLRAIFSRLPQGVNLEVVLDSCHSGTATRNLEAPDALLEPKKTTDRYLEPPVDLTFHINYLADLPTKKLLKAAAGERVPVLVPGLNHSLWAACKDNQTSQETNIGGKIQGVFTYNFCEVLKRTRGTMIRRMVDSLVTAAIRRMGFPQIPQLETSAPEFAQRPFV
jgi:hypothetical protein